VGYSMLFIDGTHASATKEIYLCPAITPLPKELNIENYSEKWFY
jgi:hypothetical protein